MTYLIIIILIIFSALFSGLTIGLLGLDKSELERKIKIGDKLALKIYSVRKNGNLLLVTLLLGNVLINSILAVFLGEMFSGVSAVIVSTVLIVVFGEILPQAVFYRYAMQIGVYFVPVVKLFQFVFYPIAKPMAMILDKFLGEEKMTVMSKKEMSEMIKSHEDSDDSDIDNDEEDILLGALTYSDKKVKEIMTPKNVVYSIEENTILDKRKLTEIQQTGFSRIPVYSENEDAIVGVINVKSLINIEEGNKAYDIHFRKKIFQVNEDEKLDDLLNSFIKKKAHIAYVTNIHNTFLGIVTMEDLIEEIIGKEIVDETDNFKDMREESKKIIH
ncbi:MAG TPA: DUF21 domain-containing protein [Candidatus Pacebacteria bacterium]|nr:DUF21 domain-containing protein [Candidatus Paceibacterota bacterium]